MKSKEIIKGLLVFIALGMLVNCGTIKYVPVKETEYVTIRDSVYFRDTTVQFRVEKEYVRDYTGLLDTLELNTSYADARAWVDTSRATLAGEIKNKEKVIDVPVSVKERIVYKDSLVYKDVPVPVEVEKVVHPKYEKWLWMWLFASVLLIGGFLYFKFFKK